MDANTCFEETLPFFADIHAAGLIHHRPDLVDRAIEMEKALDGYFLPDQQVSLDSVVDSCVRAAALYAAVTGAAWTEDRAAIEQHFTHTWEQIFTDRR